MSGQRESSFLFEHFAQNNNNNATSFKKPDLTSTVNRKKVDLLQSVRMSKEIVSELQGWEQSKGSFLSLIQPLLDQKTKEFNAMFFDYLNQLKKILAQQGFGEDVQQLMLNEENKKFKTCRKQLFGSLDNASIEVLQKEIASRKNLLNIENKIIRIQSIWRGNRVRKQYSKIIKNTKHRTNIAKEILETETGYVNNLELLVKVFKEPLDKCADSSLQILSSQEISMIFSNVQLIVNVNRELLTNLKKRIDDWSAHQCIGDIFLRLAPFLKLYVQYINNYNLSANTITHLMETKPAFASFLQKAMEAPEVRKLGSQALQNLQIMPVQRIPRYELFLRDLIKSTDEDHPDFQNLCQALFKIKDVNNKINESKRAADNLDTIMNIQKKMGLKDLIQPFRRLVKEGPVLVQKDNNGSVSNSIRSAFGYDTVPSQIYLFNDLLIVAHRKMLPTISKGEFEYRLKEIILLEDLNIKPIERDNKLVACLIETIRERRQTMFLTEKPEELKSWISAIQSASSELVKGRASLKPDIMIPSESSRNLLAGVTSTATTSSSGYYPNSTTTTTPDRTASSNNLLKVPAVGVPVKFPSTDDLISQLPSVPDLSTPRGQLATPPRSPSMAQFQSQPMQTKIGKMIRTFDDAFALQWKLFKTPKELEALMPQYLQQLPASRMVELYSHIQTLKQSLEQLTNYNDQIEQVFKKETILVNLAKRITDGQGCVGNLREWVAATFPKASSDPNAAKARMLMAYIMQWYLDLVSYWEELMEQDI